MKALLAILLTAGSCFGFQTNYTFTVEKLWDFTGEYAVDDGEFSQVLELAHQASGRVFGSYQEDYDTTEYVIGGDGSIVGSVIQTRSGLGVKLSIDFSASGHFSDGDAASLTFRGKGSLNFANRSLFGVLNGRGCLTRNARTQCATRTISIDDYQLSAQMTGTWALGLDVSTNGN